MNNQPPQEETKIAWITDSTSSLDEDFIKENDLHVVPLHIIFGDQVYRENIDITADEFYEKLRHSDVLPKTSQPTYGDFINVYEKMKDTYTHAIAVHCSSKLSGTYQSSYSAAQSVEDLTVEVIDSKIGSFPLAEMIKTGVELTKQGESFQSIVHHISAMSDRVKMYFVPENMEQLKRSGRVTGLQAFIGSLLKMKLMLKFEDGAVLVEEKIRTAKKAKAKLFETLQMATEDTFIKKVGVLHADNLTKAKEWKTELEAMFPNIQFVTMPFIPVAGTHTGDKTMGLAWIEES
ncbi:DegV family protein [Caldalkalibacillus salinus]|uniref:DegV family protein n=1 Tax=Caldalkalibacillus salinus TaxID=2803787 RepID=UPI001924087F|nr:DegV family protein [Caldalkalibacillus salinus]